jgi:hypothetical protein
VRGAGRGRPPRSWRAAATKQPSAATSRRSVALGHAIRAQALIDRACEQEPEAAAPVDDTALEAIRQAAQKVLNERLGSFDASPRGAGAERWENVLRNAGLQAPPERPIPADLDQALAEAVALRHVLAHRAGRVDARALAQAPSLRYADGDLVRVTHADYLVYSAALWTYGEEVVRLLLETSRRHRRSLTGVKTTPSTPEQTARRHTQ